MLEVIESYVSFISRRSRSLCWNGGRRNFRIGTEAIMQTRLLENDRRTSIQYRSKQRNEIFNRWSKSEEQCWSGASCRISRPRWPSSFISLRHLLSNLLPAPFSFFIGCSNYSLDDPRRKKYPRTDALSTGKTPGIENLPASVSPRSSLLGSTPEPVRWSIHFASVILLLTTTISSK